MGDGLVSGRCYYIHLVYIETGLFDGTRRHRFTTAEVDDASHGVDSELLAELIRSDENFSATAS
jgi:hypothetical protein